MSYVYLFSFRSFHVAEISGPKPRQPRHPYKASEESSIHPTNHPSILPSIHSSIHSFRSVSLNWRDTCPVLSCTVLQFGPHLSEVQNITVLYSAIDHILLLRSFPPPLIYDRCHGLSIGSLIASEPPLRIKCQGAPVLPTFLLVWIGRNIVSQCHSNLPIPTYIMLPTPETAHVLRRLAVQRTRARPRRR